MKVEDVKFASLQKEIDFMLLITLKFGEFYYLQIQTISIKMKFEKIFHELYFKESDETLLLFKQVTIMNKTLIHILHLRKLNESFF